VPERPSAEEIAKWDRFFGIECNNRAWRLSESTSRTQAEDYEMLHCAHAAALHWSKVGKELHNARATMLLGHVEALLNCPTAMDYAQHSFDYVTSHDSPAWEVAFAHAVLANAAAASGDAKLHAKHYAEAKALGAALANDEERKIFDATFKVVRAP
jgi:hypothetical protein